ncbi:MAG: hypothetical protein ACTS7E_04835 [Arsenophonus sp. NC-CH8-MAG3]
MTLKRILITGVSVFIGLGVIYYMIEDTNYSVLVVDSFTYASNLALLASVRERAFAILLLQ